jgi:hypothetical protein
MKILKIILDSTDNILGLGDDNKMYIWNEHTASWDLILVKSN